MARNALTDAGLKRLTVADNQVVRVNDGGNLRGRLTRTESGRVCRFVYRYTAAGKTVDLYLGSWPTLSLADIRAKRDEIDALRNQGIDPRAQRQQQQAEAKAEAQAAEVASVATVRKLFEAWHADVVVQAYKDAGKEVKGYFTRDVLPVIGDLPLEYLDAKPKEARAIVADICYSAKRAGHGRKADLLRSYLGQLFRHGMRLGLIDFDPTALLTGKDLHDRSPRQRSLAINPKYGKADEIGPLAEALGAAGLHERYQAAILVLLATCARVGELAKARWARVDLEAGTWLIPAEDSKNGLPHLVHLSAFAIRQFRRLQRYEEKNNPYVLPGRKENEHIDEKTLTRLIKDRQRGDDKRLKKRTEKHASALVLPGGPWTPHDLRRSGASLMGELGIAEEVVERCLNHVPVKLRKVYQTGGRLEQQKAAFIRLGQELARLIDGESAKVIPHPASQTAAVDKA